MCLQLWPQFVQFSLRSNNIQLEPTGPNSLHGFLNHLFNISAVEKSCLSIHISLPAVNRAPVHPKAIIDAPRGTLATLGCVVELGEAGLEVSLNLLLMENGKLSPGGGRP